MRVTEGGFERKTPASTLILDAQPPGLGANGFLWFEPPVCRTPLRPRAVQRRTLLDGAGLSPGRGRWKAFTGAEAGCL